MKKQLFFLFGCFLLFVQDVSAQLDTKHWIPPFFAKVEDQSGTANIRKHFVSLSTPSPIPIEVRIFNGFEELIDVVEISRDNPTEYTFGPQGNATGNPATSVYPLNVIPRDSLNIPIRSQGLYFESFSPFFVNMRHKSGSQGMSLTSKGQVGLGERFYSGHLYTIYNDDDVWNQNRRSHFISVMATEDNTTVTFDMIKDPIFYIGQTPGEDITVTLDAFESYVIGIDHNEFDNETINNANGTRITSNKPIVTNSGSWLSGNQDGQCIGADQLVPAEVTGQEYILVRGLGDETTERPMVVATEDNTEIFLNEEQTIPAAVLDEGETFFIETAEFSDNDNMYVLATEKVFMFQTLSGSSSNIGPTVGLNFIPPLNCVGAKEVNLPFVNSLAGGNGEGRINIITKAGTSIFVNDNTTPLTGSLPVPGIADWVSYAFDPPSDNVNLVSDSVMNVALLTRDGVVGTAGYFSGFTIEPVVGISSGTAQTSPCIPGNALLQVFGFDAYQWYFNGDELEGETGPTLIPEFAGAYRVEGIDLACGFRFPSNQFDIPFCDSEIGAAKSVQNVQETEPGSRIFDVTYRIFVENFAPTVASNIQVRENINGGLPAGATAEVVGNPELVFNILSGGVNPSFDGLNDRRLLPGLGSLAGGAADAIDLVIRVDMTNATQDGYFNQVVVTGADVGPNNGVDGPFNGQDFSHAGTNPDPNGNNDPTDEDENDPITTCFFPNTIEYAESVFCITEGDQPVILDGVSSGIYTTDADGLVINEETGTISPNQSEAGVYEVTFTVEGRCPTITTTEVTILPLPIPGVPVDNTEICVTAGPVPFADFLEGEEAGGVWTNASGTDVGETFTPTIAGPFDFTYTLTTAPCAPQSVSFTINVIGEPLPGISVIDPAVCQGSDDVSLFDFIDGEQPGGQWFLDGSEIGDIVTIGEPGTTQYEYQVSNEACGMRSALVDLETVATPILGTLSEDLNACAGEESDLFQFLVDADLDGTWTNADGEPVDDVVLIPLTDQVTYTYTIERSPCATASIEVPLAVTDGPSAGEANNPELLCPDGQAINLIDFMVGATPGGIWTDADGNEVPSFFTPSEEGLFEFVYTVTSIGCGDIPSDLVLLIAQENCEDDVIVIPQGFSPNNDGRADQWIISAISQYPNNNLLIFNRWGNEVFTARPYLNDWDGRASSGLNAGQGLPVGTYFYVLDLGDGSEPRKGYVYLNR